MRQIKDMWIIQIDVTNLCNKSCCNCTRFCGHYTKERIYFMDLKYIEDILITLKDFQGTVGIMGGEPLLHPQFPQILELFKKYRAYDKRGLWTNNKDCMKYAGNYFITNNIIINEHTGDFISKHTPLLTSSESIKNKYNISQDTINKCIDKCWIQNEWSATINPKGAFFCEVAGMLSYLFNGVDGINIYDHPDWWKYDLSKYQYQIDWACKKCGGALPLKSKKSDIQIDDVSEDNLEELKKIDSPKIKANKYRIYDDGFHQDDEKRDYLWNWK